MSRATTARRAPKGEYIETDSGNKISRKSAIAGTANITLGGRTVIQSDVHLRGDLHRLPHPAASAAERAKEEKMSTTAIIIGRCSIISTGCVIKPPSRFTRGVAHYMPVRIGDNVFVGPNCHVSAASIASHVHVGHDCVLQPFCIVKENVKILPHTVVPANMVVPFGAVVGGRPARVIGEVGEGWGVSRGGPGGSSASPQAAEWVEGGELRELVRAIR